MRALAQQLQNWANFVSRMTGAEEDTVLQRDSHGADTGSAESASRIELSLLPVVPPPPEEETIDDATPPNHWMARVGEAVPPAHWLERVQKAAPASEQGDQLARTPARVTEPGRSTESGAQRQGSVSPPSERDPGEVLERQANHRGEEGRRDGPVARQESQADEAYRTKNGVYQNERVARQEPRADEAYRTKNGTRQEAMAQYQWPEASETHQTVDVVRSAESTSRHWSEVNETHRATDGVQRGESMNRQRPTGDATGQMPDVTRWGETTANRPAEMRWSEPNARRFTSVEAYHVGGHPLPQVPAEEAVPPDSAIQRSTVEGVRQDRALLHVGEVLEQVHPSREQWSVRPIQPTRQDLPVQEEGPARPILPQADVNLWPSIPHVVASVQAAETGIWASQPAQLTVRWPSLPDEVTNPRPDGEAAVRAWERQKRLDEEQRGNAWTA